MGFRQLNCLLEDLIGEIKDPRLGNCYKYAWHYVYDMWKKGQDWKLVHGYLHDPDSEAVIHHAWAEKGNVVYDAVSQHKIPRGRFYALNSPEITGEYDMDKMREMALKTKHYGPWTKVDVSRLKTKSNGGYDRYKENERGRFVRAGEAREG